MCYFLWNWSLPLWLVAILHLPWLHQNLGVYYQEKIKEIIYLKVNDLLNFITWILNALHFLWLFTWTSLSTGCYNMSSRKRWSYLLLRHYGLLAFFFKICKEIINIFFLLLPIPRHIFINFNIYTHYNFVIVWIIEFVAF